jgi:hypothetical protein
MNHAGKVRCFPFFSKKKEKEIVAFVTLSVDYERRLWPTRWSACCARTLALHVALPGDAFLDDMAAKWLCFLLFLVVNFRVLNFL